MHLLQQFALLLLTIIVCADANLANRKIYCMKFCYCHWDSNSSSINCRNESLTEFPVRSDQHIYVSDIRMIDVYLDQNNLTHVPSGRLAFLAQQLHIAKLDLSNNQITNVDVDAFENLRGVEELYLDRNKLESINAATLAPLRSATQLIHLYDNNISKIEHATFANFRRLSELDLSNNRIESIHPKAFVNSAQLIHLDLSGNNLKHIPARLFFTLVNLDNIFLHLQRSPLLTIDDFAFERDTSSYDQLSLVSIYFEQTAFIHFEQKALCSRSSSRSNTRIGPFARVQLFGLPGVQTLHFNSCFLSDFKQKHPDYCNCEHEIFDEVEQEEEISEDRGVDKNKITFLAFLLLPIAILIFLFISLVLLFFSVYHKLLLIIK